MTMKRIPLAAAAVLLAGTAGGAVAFAQGNQAHTPQTPAPQQAAPAPDHGMMGHGGMMGQMDPAQMNRMMENCNRMMEGMLSPPSAPRGESPRNG